MEPSTVIDTLVGMGMPFVIALINQSQWGPKARGVIAFIACAIAAALVNVVRDELSWTNWRTSLLAVFGAAIVSYHLWWKPTTIAPAIEAATTITGPG